jgi:O-antigen/teichoic acid export membrane protein
MTVFIALLSLYTNIFIAYQSAFFYFVLMAIFGLRILPLILLAALGAIGIALSYFIALSTAIIVGYFFIGKLVNDYVLKPGIQKKIISKLASFSFGNYVAEALKYLPHVILPVLIVNRLGKDMGAYFYSAWMLAYLLFGISYYTGSMLLSALSNRRYEVRHHVAKAARLLFVLLIPSTALLFWGSNLCLSVFGASYAMEASNLLRILAFSTIPMAANELYIALCRFDKKLKRVIFIYAFIALVTISGGFLLLKTIGLLGIGIAWLSSQMALVVFTIPLTVKRVKVAAVKE